MKPEVEQLVKSLLENESNKDFVLDLSKLKCTRGRYTGSVSVNGEEKAAYGTDGSVSNIFDEALQKVEDTLGAYFSDEAEIECGKLYIVTKSGDELQAWTRNAKPAAPKQSSGSKVVGESWCGEE